MTVRRAALRLSVNRFAASILKLQHKENRKMQQNKYVIHQSKFSKNAIKRGIVELRF